MIDQSDNLKYFNTLSNKNLIKLNKEEILFLRTISDSIKLSLYMKKGNELIEIEPDLANKLNNYFDIKPKQSPLSLYIQDKINNSQNRSNISCLKLADSYFKEKGEKISKSTIHNIIKNELGYHYLKSPLKNN